YKSSTCLIAASVNEGFGLPLIEAARHGLPIIARDIPVFREVAGNYAYYFDGSTGNELADAIHRWLGNYRQGEVPDSSLIHWSSWDQSTERLKALLLEVRRPRKQLLVDISELVQGDAGTGVQRVVRSVLKEWICNPPVDYCVEPVFATVDEPFRYARK